MTQPTIGPPIKLDPSANGTSLSSQAVVDAGTYGGGVLDASSHIQDKIDSLAGSGGEVYIPPGVYRLDAQLVPASGVSVRGAGVGVTILAPQGLACGFELIASLEAPLADCSFSDFEIDGSGQTLEGAGYNPGNTKGMNLHFLERCTFQNLYIHDTGATGLGVDFLVDCHILAVKAHRCGRLYSGDFTGPIGASGIGIGTGKYEYESLTISGCHAIDNVNNGIFVETQTPEPTSKGIRIIGCYAKGNYRGFQDRTTDGTIFADCQSYENVTAGFFVELGSKNTKISGCISAANGEDGIVAKVSAGPGVAITGTEVYGNNGYGVSISATYGSPVELSGCNIHDNGLSGVNYWADRNNPGMTVRGNHIHNNGTLGVSDNRAGLRVDNPGQTITEFGFDGNRCHGQQVGVYVTPTTKIDALLLTNNNMLGLGSEYVNAGTAYFATLTNNVCLGVPQTLGHNFDAADQDTVPDSTVGAVPAEIIGTATYGIRDQQLAVLPGGASRSFLVFESGEANGTVEITLSQRPATMALLAGLAFRCGGVGVSGFYLDGRESGSVEKYALFRVTDGASVRISQAGIGPTPVAGDRLRVQFTGATIRWFVNGVPIETLRDANFINHTKHGAHGSGTLGVDMRLDDFTFAPIQ